MVQIIRLDPITLAALDPDSSDLQLAVQDVEQSVDETTAAVTASGVLIGAVGETAPANDTASSGLNGRLQRIAQRITSLIALVPTALGKAVSTGAFLVTESLDNRADSTYRVLSSANTTNGANIKASAGNVWKIFGNNTVAAKKYLKLYNKATAPTVGTDTPVMTIVIPASAAFNFEIPGRYFSTGIGIAITGAAADNDTTAIGTGDIECLNLLYK